jgi:hypothetical protein
MESEALRNIKTMRQVKTSLDVARRKNARTTNNLSKSEEERAQLEAVNSKRTGQVLAKERIRFMAYEASVNKSRQRLLQSRKKLAEIINKNKALGEMRSQLQDSRWQKQDQTQQAKPAAGTPALGLERLHPIELKY